MFNLLPSDIIYHILSFMSDKIIVKCSLINKQLCSLTRDDKIWYDRFNDNFGNYINNKIKMFFIKHLTYDVMIDKMKEYVNNKLSNANGRTFLYNTFTRAKRLLMVKNILQEPIYIRRIIIHHDTRASVIKYEIHSNICYIKNKRGWMLGYRQLTYQDLYKSIIKYMSLGYYISRSEVNEKVGDKLLQSSLAIKI